MTRLSAKELELPDDVYAALLWTRDALDPTIPDTDLPPWLIFDMGCWADPIEGDDLVDLIDRSEPDSAYSPWISQELRAQAEQPQSSDPICGTAACIGGTMVLYLRDQIESQTNPPEAESSSFSTLFGSTPLWDLFFRFDSSSGTSRTDAVAAIDRFLAGQVEDPWCISEIEQERVPRSIGGA